MMTSPGQREPSQTHQRWDPAPLSPWRVSDIMIILSGVCCNAVNIAGPQIPAGYQMPGQPQVQMMGMQGMPGLMQPAVSIAGQMVGMPGQFGIRQPFLAAGMTPG